MIKYTESEMLQVMPEPLKYKAEVVALSYAIKRAIGKMVGYAERASVYAAIDKLPEDILDLLAVELRAQYYDEDMDISIKREIVKKTMLWYHRAGTPSAVEELISAVFGEGEISEWFEYAVKTLGEEYGKILCYIYTKNRGMIRNVYLNGRMMGYSRKEMDERLNGIVEFADIGDFINQPVKTYSSGMFARLAFAVAINVEPDILIVDEALSVGDIFFQNKCFKKFDELKRNGVTILFVSHDIGSVRQMCSRVLWLDHGTVRAFGEAAHICDMYMDEKRKSAEYVAGHIQDEVAGNVFMEKIDEERKYPKISFVEDRFHNDSVAIRSLFFTDSEDKAVNRLYVDKTYRTHVVIECMKDAPSLIVGFVLENNKGLPLFDINNFINQGEVVNGKKNDIIEIVYEYTLPRIMNGVYLVGAAVGQGTQSKHEMLTWLHGIMELEVVNQGYNSSYIEIPSKIRAFSNRQENVMFL